MKQLLEKKKSILVYKRGPSVAGGASEPPYLFRDEFTTDLTAGNVNGTACEPGPYNRVVTDTNSKLSIASGKISLLNGGVGYGNPGYWADNAFTRAAGLTLSARLTGASMIGWSSGKSGSADRHATYISGTSLLVYNNTVSIDAGTALGGVDHNLTIILRAGGGAWYFVQGGIYTDTEMVWADTPGAGNVYPAIVSVGGSSIGSVSYIRVPQAVTIPTACASDSFNRTNSAVLGATDGAGHADGVSGNGLTWTNQLGAFGITTNRAKAASLDAGGMAISTVNTGKLNILLENVTLTRAGGIVGVVLRYSDADNYIYAGHDGTNAILVKRVAGTETTVGTTAKAFGAGLLSAMCSGTTFRVWWNRGIIGGGTLTIDDAALQSSTTHGLYTTDIGNTADALVMWPRGS